MGSYYEMARGSDLITRGNLLYGKDVSLRKVRCGSLSLELLEEEEARMRLGQLSLENISASGLPQEESDRYYSSS